jgi:hypothetical protein
MLNFKRLALATAAAAALFTFFQYADLPDIPIVRASSISNTLTFAALHANDTSVNAAGTQYTLTASDAAVTFGTTSPAITIRAAGTWQITAQMRYDNVGATYAASRNVFGQIERTNNTPGIIAASGINYTTGIVTTVTNTMGFGSTTVLYTTSNANDALALFCSVSVLPTAGSSIVASAKLTAIRLY